MKGYRANFLWPPEDDSIEQIGYEFANGKTDEYQKQSWELLVNAIREKAKSDIIKRLSEVKTYNEIANSTIDMCISQIEFLDKEK